MAELVLGFRPHTYWTAVVALGGPANAPEVVLRKRLIFARGREREAFHQAAEIGLKSAPTLIENMRASTTERVLGGLEPLLADLKSRSCVSRLAVVPGPTAKLPDSLEAILASHSRIHAAEGDFYRDIVAAGCTAAGLKVVRVAEKEIPLRLAQCLSITAAELASRLKDLGARLGPPWSEDERLAFQAAWLGPLEAALTPQ
ncbi:MAG: hypothetical protein ACRED9_05530 [Caulobacteraceae bacterium]